MSSETFFTSSAVDDLAGRRPAARPRARSRTPGPRGATAAPSGSRNPCRSRARARGRVSSSSLQVAAVHRRLRDGLAVADRQRRVLVRAVPDAGGHEHVARRAGRTRAAPRGRGCPCRAASRRAAAAAPRSSSSTGFAPPFARRPEDVVVGDVEVQRRHRDVAVLDGAEVRVVLAAPTDRAAADPVDRPAPRILHRRERAGIDATAEPRELHALHVVGRQSAAGSR